MMCTVCDYENKNHYETYIGDACPECGAELRDHPKFYEE